MRIPFIFPEFPEQEEINQNVTMFIEKKIDDIRIKIVIEDIGSDEIEDEYKYIKNILNKMK